MQARESDFGGRGRLSRGVVLLAAGLVALGTSGAARAGHEHGYAGSTVQRVVVVETDARRHQRSPHRRYKRHHRRGRPARVVHIYHYAPAPPTVVREYHHYGAPAPAPAARYDRGSDFNAQSLVGAAIGGLLGAQVGRGSGNQAATAAGAVTGLFLGSHFGR